MSENVGSVMSVLGFIGLEKSKSRSEGVVPVNDIVGPG